MFFIYKKIYRLDNPYETYELADSYPFYGRAKWKNHKIARCTNNFARCM